MRYDAEQKQRTRARILTEAAKAVRASGPHKVGVAEVMARAGLTHGGFYAHFKSKDALLAATIARMFEAPLETLDALAAERPAREALAGYVRFYLSAAHRDAHDAGCPLPGLVSESPRLSQTGRASFEAGVTALQARLASLMHEAGSSEPEAAARSMLSELLGALSVARAMSDVGKSDAVMAASRQAILARLDPE